MGYLLLQNKHFIESQTRRMELESAVGELEKTAQQQLRGLASQSETAIEAAQKKLSEAYYAIQQYQLFVKVCHLCPSLGPCLFLNRGSVTWLVLVYIYMYINDTY